MRQWLIAIVLSVVQVYASGAEISDFDIATYGMQGKDGQDIDMKVRLSKQGGQWVLEGKEGPSAWRNISCDKGCELRPSTAQESLAYLASFPSDMHERFNIACIQNTANAFCRVTKKSDASKGGYALVALVTGTPRPMSLRRLTR